MTKYYIVLATDKQNGIQATCTAYGQTGILTEDEADELIEDMTKLHGVTHTYKKLPVKVSSSKFHLYEESKK